MTALPSTDRPLAAGDGWVEWHGGENPVPGQMVNVRQVLGQGNTTPMLSDHFGWEFCGLNEDIIAYRLSRPAPVPEAGEGVGPVAWRWRFHADDSWHHGDSNPGKFRFGDPDDLEPLYLHPAPTDRVAELEAALRTGNLWWNQEDWETTFDGIEDAYDAATQGEMRGVAALGRATQHETVFAVRIDIDTTGDGDADDYEIRLFPTREAAISAQPRAKGEG